MYLLISTMIIFFTPTFVFAEDPYSTAITEYQRCMGEVNKFISNFKDAYDEDSWDIVFTGFQDNYNGIKSILAGGRTYNNKSGIVGYPTRYYEKIYIVGVGRENSSVIDHIGVYCIYPVKVGSEPIVSEPPIRPKNFCGSVIGSDEQTLGESLALPGTEWRLHYSTQTSKRPIDYTLKTPLNHGDTNLSEVQLRVELWDTKAKIPVIGNDIEWPLTFVNNFKFQPPLNIQHEFLWNGRNENGTEATASRLFYITKILKYKNGYSENEKYFLYLGHFNAQVYGLGGWTLTPHHYLDTVSNRIYLGSGGLQNVDLSVHAVKAFDTQGKVIGYNLHSEDLSLIYRFDIHGRHLYTQNSFTLKKLLEFQYDSNGFLLAIKDVFGHTYSINRSANQIEFLSWTGHRTTMKLNNRSLASDVIFPDNSYYKMTYLSGTNLLSALQKPSGVITYFSYNSKGELIKDQTSSSFLSLIKTQDQDNKQIDLLTALGRKTKILIERIFIEGNNVTQGISAFRRTQTRPDGLTTVVTDNNDNYLNVASGSNQSIYQWTDDDLLKSNYKYLSYENHYYPRILSSIKNKVLTKTRVLRQINAEDPFDLIALEVLTTITTSGQVRTLKQRYDRASNTTLLTSAEGRTKKLYHNDYGGLVKEESSFLYPIEYIYDIHGRLTQIKQNNRSYLLSYNLKNELISTRNPLGEIVQFQYDSMSRLIQTKWANGQVDQYSYDVGGRRTQIIPSSRSAHVFTFNAWDMVSRYMPSILSTGESILSTFSFSADKELTYFKRGDNRGIKYTYNPLTAQISRVQTLEKTLDFTYEPLVDGSSLQKVEIKDNQGVVQRVEKDLDTGLNHSMETRAENILDKNQIPLDYKIEIYRSGPSLDNLYYKQLYMYSHFGQTYTHYEHNKDDQVIQANEMTLSYRSDNGLLVRTVLGRITQQFGYTLYGDLSFKRYIYSQPATKDNQGNTIPAKNITVFEQRYSQDNLGRITAITEVDPVKTLSKSYQFDSRGRLTQSVLNNLIQKQYSYDGNGNRLTLRQVPQNVTQSYQFDAQDRLVLAGTDKLVYNLHGELQQKIDGASGIVKNKYQFDSHGQLSSSWQNNITVGYIYDTFQRRLARTRSGKITHRYAWLDDTKLLAELNDLNEISKWYVYVNRHVPEFMYVQSNGNKVIYQLITDQIGSVRKVINVQTGQIMQEVDYDEFGNVIKDTNPGFQSFGFAGGLYDPDTKLVKFGARTYDPSIGRWISKDPILFDGGDTNLYGYVANDPINHIDPTGLICNYSQSSGTTICSDINGNITMLNRNGYAGNGSGYNNPNMQNVPNVGPLPQGSYTVGDVVPRTPSGLINALPLTPNDGTNTYGRGGFFIHGDNPNKPPGSSSNGCPIINNPNRSLIPSGEIFNVGL